MTYFSSVPLLLSLLAGAALAVKSREAAREAAVRLFVLARRRGAGRRAG